MKLLTKPLLGIIALLSPLAISPGDPDTYQQITVDVECGSQGILDVDWELEFDVYDENGGKFNTEPIKIFIADGTRSETIATRIAVAVNELTRPTNPPPGWNGHASTKETEHPSVDPYKGEDVVIESPYSLGNFKSKRKKKKKGDKDHLKIFSGSTRINNTSGPGGIGSQAAEVKEATVDILDTDCETIGIAATIVGFRRSTGLPFEKDFLIELPGTTSHSDIADQIKTKLESYGIPVTKPSSTSVEADFLNSGFMVTAWWFALYDASDADPADIESTVVYTAW